MANRETWEPPEEPIVFCVPLDGKLRLKLLDYRLGGQSIEADEKKIQSALSIKRLGLMRRWPLATVALAPNFFAPARKQADAQPGDFEARLAIEWDRTIDPPPAPVFAREIEKNWGWGRVGDALVENPEGLRLFQVEQPPAHEGVSQAPASIFDAARPDLAWVRMRVDGEGLWRIDLEKLAALGFDRLPDDPSGIRLFYHGHPHPVLRRKHEGRENIYFWNNANDSVYGKERVYWIAQAPEIKERSIPRYQAELSTATIRNLDRTRRTAKLDRDNQLVIAYGEFREILRWDWLDAPLEPGVEIETPLRFDHPVPSSESYSARFQFYFDYDEEDKDRLKTENAFVTLSKAGARIGRSPVGTEHDQIMTFEIMPDRIDDGLNTFTLTLTTPAEESDPGGDLWLDRVDVDYDSYPLFADGRLTLRADDATTAPTHNRLTFGEDLALASDVIALTVGDRASGDANMNVWKIPPEEMTTFTWPAGERVELYIPEAVRAADRFEVVRRDDLLDENQGADYLIIAHHDFLDAIEPLAERRRAEGLRVRIVDVQAIYDRFSHGELTPFAIRDFLAFTLNRWRGGAPTYVLLVGDCTNDYRNFVRNDVNNYVPSYSHHAGKNPWASDEWMGLVAGTDVMVDFMIGRFSVEKTEDLDAIVRKQLQYPTHPLGGPWQARMGWIADKQLEFPAILDEIRADRVPPAMAGTRVYQSELPVVENRYADDAYRRNLFEREGEWLKLCTEATERIFAMMRGGTSVLTYFGHGSPNVWALERMWFGGDHYNSDNLHLRNTDFTTFVINLTCNSGAIDYPIRRWNVNIIEDMMRTENGGAIACLAPSGPGVTSDHKIMGREIFNVLFTDGERGLGEIVALTKARFAARRETDEFPYMYIFLGDPALDLRLASDVRTFELPRGVYRPGQTIEAAVAIGNPTEGQYRLQVVNERGDALWTSEPAGFDLGRIAFHVPLSEDFPLGSKTLRLDAWNADSGREMTASASFEIVHPRGDFGAVKLTTGLPDQVKMSIEVTNASAVDGEGFKIETRPAAGHGEPVMEQTLDLKSGETRMVEFTLPRNSQSVRPPVWEARLIAPGLPHRLDLPAAPTKRIVAPAARQTQAAWAPDACGRRLKNNALRTWIFSAVAVIPTSNRTWLAGIESADGDLLSTQPLYLSPIDADFDRGDAEFELAMAAADQALMGTLWLAAAPDEGESANDKLRVVDRIAVRELKLHHPRLRLRPDSLRTEPENPTEGSTIFVHVDVENVGDEISEPAMLELLKSSPDQGGEKVYNHIRDRKVQVEKLGPGRSQSMTLRWDPIDNAGVRPFWVRLRQDGNPGFDGKDALLEGTVRARTRSEVKQGRIWAAANKLDMRKRRIFLKAEVINEGETEAQNISVFFFRGKPPNAMKLIHEDLIDVLPGQTKKTVIYEWDYGVDPDYREIAKDPSFWTMILMKGSGQRIFSTEGETMGLPGMGIPGTGSESP